MMTKIIDEVKPDIIHINNHMSLGRTALTLGKERNIPVIGTNHFMPENLLEYFPKFMARSITKFCGRTF